MHNTDDRIADIWGPRTPQAKDAVWPVRVDQQLAEGVSEDEVDRWVQSACVLCSNGCGCDIAVKDGRMVGIRGRSEDRVNHGRLGPKGLYGQHADEPDVAHVCKVLAGQSAMHVDSVRPIVSKYGEQDDPEPERLQAAEFAGTREGGVGLLRDLQDLYTMASFVDITWTVVYQAAQGLRDQELIEVARSCHNETTQQLTWLTTRIKQAAPQALIVAK